MTCERARERNRFLERQCYAGRVLLLPDLRAESLDQRLLEEAFKILIVGAQTVFGSLTQTFSGAK